MKLLKIFFWLVLIIGAGAFVAAGYAAKRWFEEPVPGLSSQTVLIPAGSTYRSLVQRLERRELIELPVLWRIAGRLTGADSKIQAGEYEMPVSVTPQQVLKRLSQGEGLVSYKVAFIEGWNLREVRGALRNAPQLVQSMTDVPVGSWATELGLESESAEGWFFPDTYAYNRGSTDRQILLRAYERMQRVLEKSWQGRAGGLILDSPYEALILASIVEKETGRGSDRSTISQVFNRRLSLGMKLQTDPTVIYGIGPDFDGDITRKHLRTDTPYNSYTRFGLPPTPIALAGKESIEASLHPADTEYLYFVARGDGTSQFSETLADHNKAVRRYQLKRGN